MSAIQSASGEPRRVALVTGASRGLGLGVTRELARRGFEVLQSARSEGARPLAEELARAGQRVRFELLDVADAASVDALAARLERDGIALDVLVNNAAISMNGFNARVAEQTLATNFFGALRLSERLLGARLARTDVPGGRTAFAPGAHIVMVSSGMGELSCLSAPLQRRFLDPGLERAALAELMHEFVRDVERGQHRERGWPSSAYSVSKVGLNALVRVLDRELGERVHVNAVCPGWVRTDMGGSHAPRSLEQGVASILWPVLGGRAPNGGFFRDGRAIAW